MEGLLGGVYAEFSVSDSAICYVANNPIINGVINSKGGAVAGGFPLAVDVTELDWFIR